MKTKKMFSKVFALLLAAVMMFAMSTTAFAATITVNKAVNGETYTAYKLLDVSYSNNAYSYYVTDATLKGKLESVGLTFTKSADGTRYTVNQQKVNGNVVFTTSTGTMTAADLAAAINTKLAADPSWLTAATTGVKASSNTATISVGTAGYYFVDSSLGSLCILNTADEDMTVEEKNQEPGITKTVKEDSTDSYGETATIDVSDTIYYKLVVTVGDGVDANYTIKDVLPTGITYNADSLTVEGMDEAPAVTSGTNNSISFTIPLAILKADENKSIEITYTASAADNLTNNVENKNTVTLSYKEQTYTDDAVVKTYDIGGDDLVKRANSETGDALGNVEFKLQNNTTKKYAKLNNDGSLDQWVTDMKDATVIRTNSEGKITVSGLDADTYILTETKTVDGYNLLNDTITVVVNEDGTETYKLTSASEEAGASINVVNTSGSELPSTGGIGTTIFYVIGSVMVAGALVLLVVKKRMSNYQD